MKLTKLLGLSVIAAGLFSVNADAATITATWRGMIGEGESSVYNNVTGDQTDLAGQSMEMTFVFDTAALGPPIYNGSYYDEYYGVSQPGFFTSATLTLSGGASTSLSTPSSYAVLLFGDLTKYYPDLYYTFGNNVAGDAGWGAYFYNFTGGVTTLDPGQTFTHYLTAGDVFYRSFTFTDGDLTYSDYASGYVGDTTYGTPWTSLTVTSSEDVPAPAALALLGFGLAGVGALRHRRKTA